MIIGSHISDLQSISDTELIDRFREGQRNAFEELVHRYNRTIFHYLYRMSGNYDVAEDLVQEVFIHIFRALPHLDTRRPLKPWLFQVAHNCCIDELRRQRRRAVPISFIAPPDETEEESACNLVVDPDALPDEKAEQHELQQILHETIQMLPIKYRTVISLRYALQLKYIEIGMILNMPEATVKTYFTRAKYMLRRILQEKYSSLFE